MRLNQPASRVTRRILVVFALSVIWTTQPVDAQTPNRSTARPADLLQVRAARPIRHQSQPDTSPAAPELVSPQNPEAEALPARQPLPIGVVPIGELTAAVKSRVKDDAQKLLEPPRNLAEQQLIPERGIEYRETAWGNQYLAYDISRPPFCHRPLLFEDVALERYGQSWGILQPAVSGVRFYATVPALPYKATLERAARCGYGSPERCGRYPFRVLPAAVEACLVTGLVFIIP